MELGSNGSLEEQGRPICFEGFQSFVNLHPSQFPSQGSQVTFQRRLNVRWRTARPWLQPSVSTFTLPEEAGSTLLLLGMDENAVVVRSTDSSSLVRTWAEVREEIKLMVIEKEKHWEVGIAPSDKSEIFYRAEITPTMVAAVTDLGTIAVWHRVNHQLIHCRLILMLCLPS